MNDDVFTLTQKLQPYLLNNDYTFGGPVAVDLFDSCIEIATKNHFIPLIVPYLIQKLLEKPYNYSPQTHQFRCL
jgi:hypothetical protein